VVVSGQATDEVGLESMVINIHNMAGMPLPAELAEITINPERILKQELNLSGLSDGLYNIDVKATDKAKNVTHVSRNVRLIKDSIRNFVDNLYPLEGEHVQGSFNLYGYTGGIDRARTVTITVNGIDGETAAVNDAGYFRFALDGDFLEEGRNVITVRGDFGGTETVSSGERIIEYRHGGAWVSIDSLTMGDFVYERPWLSGRAGYALTEEDEAVLAGRKADRDLRKAVEQKTLKQVEISFDNGKTFLPARDGRNKEQDWAYRLETQDMTEGVHYLIVRAAMENGETAITRTLIQVADAAGDPADSPPGRGAVQPDPGLYGAGIG
jgi:hypothetical protein